MTPSKFVPWRRIGLLGLSLLGASACGADSTGTPEAAPGTEGGSCRPHQSCDAGLTCLSQRCVKLPEAGSGGDADAESGGTGATNGGGAGGHSGSRASGGAGGVSTGNAAGGSESSGGGEGGSAGSDTTIAGQGGVPDGVGGDGAGGITVGGGRAGAPSRGSGGDGAGGSGLESGGGAGRTAGAGGANGGVGGTAGAGAPNGGGGGDASGLPACDGELGPQVEFASPYVALANHATTIIVRGTGLTAGGSLVTVDVGTTRIGPLAADSATQVTVQVPGLPAGRYPVRIEGTDCAYDSDAELLVLAPTPLGYHAISAPSGRQRIVWDAERQTLYAVNRVDQEIERYRYANGTFTTLSACVVPDLTDIALAPNGRTLVVSSSNAISEIQLDQSTCVATAYATNPDTFCSSYFAELTAANDGTFLVIYDYAACSGFSASYLYDMRSHSLQSNPYFEGYLYNGLAGGSFDGSRIYAGSNGVSPAQPIKIYNSLNHSLTDATPSYNLATVSVSGDASRVILQNVDVYSRALTLTGHLPPSSGVLASLDSTRAFLFDPTGSQPAVVVHDLNGDLEAGALYPVAKTVNLSTSPNANGSSTQVTMASTLDDSTVFVSGDRYILVVPVD